MSSRNSATLSLSRNLREIVLRAGGVICRDVPSPLDIDEPPELNFIETVAGFHHGYMNNPETPRQTEIYDSCLRKLAEIITYFMLVISASGVPDCSPVGLARLDLVSVGLVLDMFDVDTHYPVENLLFRLAKAVTVIIAHPLPKFQTTFITSLPVETICMIEHFLDDRSALRLTQTCRNFRAICPRRPRKSAFFRMRYHNFVLHGLSVVDDEAMYIDVLEAMILSARNTSRALVDFATKDIGTSTVRTVSIDNEWPRAWPRYIPSHPLVNNTYNMEVFEILYNAVITTIVHIHVVHLRLVSLLLTIRVTDHICVHPTITRMTLVRCESGVRGPGYSFHGIRPMNNITALTLGFGPDTRMHARGWSLICLFPELRHLSVYADADYEGGILFPAFRTTLAHVHFLETLHIRNASEFLEELVHWLDGAGQHHINSDGSLRCLKIHTDILFNLDDVLCLVTVLGQYHPSLEVLSIDAIDHVYPYFFSHINHSLHQLKGLTISRRYTHGMHSRTLCIWDKPGYAYAQALRGLSHLQHVSFNMFYSREWISPRLLFDPVDPDATVSDLNHGELVFEGENELATALPFASQIATLSSFAIHSDTVQFSCSIRRTATGAPIFEDICCDPDPTRNQTWNPTDPDFWMPEPV